MVVIATRTSAFCSFILLFVILGCVFAGSSDIGELTSSPSSIQNLSSVATSTKSITAILDPQSSNISRNTTREKGKNTNSAYSIYDIEKWVSWKGLDEFPESDIPDKYYFEFTQANIDDSRVAEFYTQWTMERQFDPDWNKTGEFKLFNSDFGNTRNFECGTAFGLCIEKLSLRELQSLWPGDRNRAFVRRIYFTLYKYELLHTYTLELLDTFKLTHVNIIGYIPEMITTFTEQADARKIQNCALIKLFIDQAVNIAISISTSLVGNAIAAVGRVGLEMGWNKIRFGKTNPKVVIDAQEKLLGSLKSHSGMTRLAKKDAEKALKSAFENKVGVKGIEKIALEQGVSKDLVRTYKNAINNAKPMEIDWVGMLWGQVVSSGMYAGLISQKIHMNDLQIEGGMSYGTLCSQFEGDFADYNVKNRDMLLKFLPKFFDQIRMKTQDNFNEFYKGVIIEPGKPSLMAYMMANRVWEGEGSVLDGIRKPADLQFNIEKTMVKNIASDILARGYNYNKCTHHPEAAKLCRDAQKHQQGIGLSRFCPEPETDPNLICQLGKWFMAVHQPHEVQMVGINGFERFIDNKYNLTLAEFQKESWDSYKRCGNKCSDTQWDKLAFGASLVPGWEIPTCVNDGIRINNFLTHQGSLNNENAWGFPSICGNFHSNETRDFMEAMHIGFESNVYKGRAPLTLWLDRIPRELDRLPPYENYMALCKQGIRFPRHGEYPNKKNTPLKGIVGPAVKFKFFPWGADKDCDMVAKATAELDEYDANDWFCFSEEGRKIQKAQRNHVDMSHIPLNILYGAKHKCNKWGKGGGGIRVGKGSKGWKSERKSREAHWKTKTSGSSLPTSTTPSDPIATTIIEAPITTLTVSDEESASSMED